MTDKLYLIGIERIKHLLTYEPDTGVFTRRITRGKQAAGTIAGGLNWDGYLSMQIDGKNCLLHRLAWFYITGEAPRFAVDHINGLKTDNRWVNLREATKSQNQLNRYKTAKNTIGFKGVKKSGNKFQAAVQLNGKLHYIGIFDTEELAGVAYYAAAKVLHGEFFASELQDKYALVDSEPVAYMRYVERGHAPDDYWTDLEICDVDTKDAFPVYTSPQALTPITADDVTDEMVSAYHTTTSSSKEAILRIVNAWIKHRSEA